ncbi:RNA methyltransferase [Rhodopila sp.]|uniref:RNA methyltransferase n=1 Tax=Rhodopila sp. TaxID=2480087 RepID=UPI002BCF58B9|nr:RNA methyltransferase [Rhodopila sp.]HVZ07557.1 RNA methyltransferase [Rhodopila sp.]
MTGTQSGVRARGYFGLGVEGVSKSANVGALLRTGHAFGAVFCFTIGAGWDSRAARTADTSHTQRHVPMWRFPAVEALSLPRGCALVGIELLPDAVDLPSFRHPLNAAYVLGPERAGLSPALLARCDHVVRIPTRFALNLAVAGALVLYDRLLQHGRFAERPVGSRAAQAPLPPTGHGAPRFRRTIPDWLADRQPAAAGEAAEDMCQPETRLREWGDKA